MSNKKNNYSILIQVQNPNESERLISVFRSAGVLVRAHRVTSEQDFKESVSADSWDLLIADNRHPEVGLPYSLETLKKCKKDIPLLLVSEDMSAEFCQRAFQMGIQDVVDRNNDSHFVHAAVREMDNARQRRRCQQLDHDYQELVQRAEKLMADSDDAIAYVSDGILMKVNDIFAGVFGYSVDELDCGSIIDLVADQDQDKFKNFFRHFGKGDGQQAELSFRGRKKDKQEFDAFISLAASSIDGDPCTQVNIATAAESANNGGGSGIIDNASGLFNRYYLAEQIGSTALQIGKGVSSASLLLFRLDNYEKLLDDVFFSGIDALIKDLADHLKEKTADAVIGRLGNDAVAMILTSPSDKALAFARDALASIEAHICEIDSRTVQFTCCCAVLPLNIKDAGLMIDSAFEGIANIRLSKDKNHAAVFTAKQREAAKPGVDDVATIDEAIEQGCFKLLYQPMMSLQGDELENYEVSVWFTDGGKDVYPADLIKAAGNSKLDRWIILQATKALSLHRADGHNTRLLINLTLNALQDNGIPAWLGVATKAANLNPDLLLFQFSEDDVKNNLKSAIKTIAALRKAKFKVSIGQFACDEEPFKLLKHLQLDMVKFDPRHTANIAKGDSVALKALIDAAKENNIKTILPDVDNAGALATLWQLGTHYIQGSYLQLPSAAMNYEFAEIA